MYLHYVSVNSIHEKGFHVERMGGVAGNLILFVHTPCDMTIAEQSYHIDTNSVILFSNRSPHRYMALTDPYRDDYVHFEAEQDSGLFDGLTFPFDYPIRVENDISISSILSLLQQEHIKHDIGYEECAGLQIRYLLLIIERIWQAEQQRRMQLPYYERLLAVREEILAHPEQSWTVARMAEKANLSHTYFQIIYKRAFGITCVTEVILAKLAAAKTLLSSTELSVNEISAVLGYNEVYHFIRQFHKYLGITPGKWRHVQV